MIKIDVHEPQDLLIELREAFKSDKETSKVPVVVESLPNGDFVFLSSTLDLIVIERKEIHDYLNSLRSHRLMDQIFRLLTEADMDIPILLIEGVLSLTKEGKCKTYKRTTDWSFSAVSDFELSAQRQGVIVLHIPSHKHTAMYIHDLYKYFQKDVHESLAIPPMPFPTSTAQSLRDIRARPFLALPGVGGKRASTLVKRYKCISRLCDAPEKEIIDLVGKTTGGRIYRALHI